eukprot:TRINITY_DN53166_c0_g1_i1.p1 TRINITY_DN53166_c0_g1~~TRINITY_DN53166_c0_g1_i1.p1  ORF type:complete len:189 (+),score=11.23 TRINITY_DN53166_c0_g1_i1:28-567(+)
MCTSWIFLFWCFANLQFVVGEYGCSATSCNDDSDCPGSFCCKHEMEPPGLAKCAKPGQKCYEGGNVSILCCDADATFCPASFQCCPAEMACDGIYGCRKRNTTGCSSGQTTCSLGFDGRKKQCCDTDTVCIWHENTTVPLGSICCAGEQCGGYNTMSCCTEGQKCNGKTLKCESSVTLV